VGGKEDKRNHGKGKKKMMNLKGEITVTNQGY